MKVKFSIDYRTHWGQQLFICGSASGLGSWQEEKAIQMQPASGEEWEAEVELDESEFSYKYLVKTEGSDHVDWEFGDPRSFSAPSGKQRTRIRDFWRPVSATENALYTSPFTRAFFNRGETMEESGTDANPNLRMQIRTPRVGKDYQVGIIGSCESLGAWDESKVILMNDRDFPVWQVDLHVSANEFPFEYKYVIYNKKTNQITTWENRENRYFQGFSNSDTTFFVRTDEFFSYPVGAWKAAGVAIPVFSIRTEKSGGVGEFTDLKPLVDWSVKTGMKIVQVLPVNDTVATHTWMDSYPYAAISVEALHPIYANMETIGRLKNEEEQKKLDDEIRKLNELEEIDYMAVMKAKSRFFKLSYDENRDEFLKSSSFSEFFKKNEHWLPDYAAFSYLRDKFRTPDFNQWGEYSSLTDERVAELVSPERDHYDDIAVHYYIQFHLDKQLREASLYARQNGVVLKGDIPIGIYRYSVDAWRHPNLYNMDVQAGAPPDDFSVTGQNWGFPTYNWEEMAKDGFEWWKDRMVTMSRYFDVFRIDHILGFFRIWEIPWEHVQGLLGYFNPALPFSTDELQSWGIWFDYDRFCKPYIRRHMIYDIFNVHADHVFDKYLDEIWDGAYAFKEAFDSQRKIDMHIDQLIQDEPESTDFFNWMRNELFRLHGEVLFIPAGGNMYNPRIDFPATYSFAELDDYTKSRLHELHTHYFYRRHNDFWRDSAMTKLPMLKSATDMLICGEDLGMVPASVPGVMNELQILSLAIQRMPGDDREFWHPMDTSYLSVTSTGSHDMSTLREWWQEDPAQTQRFYNQILGHSGGAPFFCEPWVAKDVIDQHLKSPSMLAIFPIQDLIAMNARLRRESPEVERINVPANPKNYWRYRFHLNMEQLLEEDDFNFFLRRLVDQGGRISDY